MTTSPQLAKNLLPARRPPARRHHLVSPGDIISESAGDIAGIRSTAPEIEQAAVDLAIEQPAWGQVRVSEMLKRRGLSISPAGVRGVWQRHDLTSMKHRLKALEAELSPNFGDGLRVRRRLGPEAR